jgi:CBS domain containing-hemolysin-like protein
MYDPMTLLLAVAVVILISVIVIFLIMLIVVLFLVKKTLLKLQVAIDNVEDTAIRSLAPFLSLRAMFSDTASFWKAVSKIFGAVKKQKRS